MLSFLPHVAGVVNEVDGFALDASKNGRRPSHFPGGADDAACQPCEVSVGAAIYTLE